MKVTLFSCETCKKVTTTTNLFLYNTKLCRKCRDRTIPAWKKRNLDIFEEP